MLKNCERFIKNRTESGGGWLSYASLEQNFVRVQDQMTKLRELNPTYNNDNNEPCDVFDGACCCGTCHSLDEWTITRKT